ncbi:MAG: hypothetical protein JGK01_20445 [Microcoleus sp. PH2017_03_ELD_O_A]|nr:hypothetical protein [Microcoleus sp. PH2017_03_ELD_O_A]
MIRAEFKSPFLSLRTQLSTVNCQLFNNAVTRSSLSDNHSLSRQFS